MVNRSRDWFLQAERDLEQARASHSEGHHLRAAEKVTKYVILRSCRRRRISKHVDFTSTEILRGVYPELVEGLRMTGRSFRMETN